MIEIVFCHDHDSATYGNAVPTVILLSILYTLGRIHTHTQQRKKPWAGRSSLPAPVQLEIKGGNRRKCIVYGWRWEDSTWHRFCTERGWNLPKWSRISGRQSTPGQQTAAGVSETPNAQVNLRCVNHEDRSNLGLEAQSSTTGSPGGSENEQGTLERRDNRVP